MSKIAMEILGSQFIQQIEKDTVTFSPLYDYKGSHPVSAWLERYQERFTEILTNLIRENSRYNQEAAHALARTVYLPEFTEELRRHAIRRIALRWCAPSYPPVAKLGFPKPDAGLWIVPVLSASTETPLGQIVMDNEGNVIPEGTTTGKQLREVLSVAPSR